MRFILFFTLLCTHTHAMEWAAFTMHPRSEEAFEMMAGVQAVGAGDMIIVVYNPETASFPMILNAYLRTVNPLTGSNTVYYTDDYQKNTADDFLNKLKALDAFKDKNLRVYTEPFAGYPQDADIYQNTYKNVKYPFTSSPQQSQIPQDYFFRTNKMVSTAPNILMVEKFQRYRKPPQSELKLFLTRLEYAVTQEGATEPPYTDGSFYDNTNRGIYVDILSGEPLFSSRDKVDLDDGRVHFKYPMSDEFTTQNEDYSFFMKRTAVKSKYADSHLGFITDDGLYRINGAALRFIPYDEMSAEGYEDYKSQT